MEENDNINKLSPMLRIAYGILKQAMSDIVAGKCDEQDVSSALSSIHPERQGYKKEEDYVTIDKGMKLLGMGKNRNDFCKMMKKHGILNEKFNTIKIGFNRHKILALRHKEEEAYQQRLHNIEEKHKKQKEKQNDND